MESPPRTVWTVVLCSDECLDRIGFRDYACDSVQDDACQAHMPCVPLAYATMAFSTLSCYPILQNAVVLMF